MNELTCYDMENINHLVSFLCLSFYLPFGASSKLISGPTHCEHLGPSFQLSISPPEAKCQITKSRSELLLRSCDAAQGKPRKPFRFQNLICGQAAKKHLRTGFCNLILGSEIES